MLGFLDDGHLTNTAAQQPQGLTALLPVLGYRGLSLNWATSRNLGDAPLFPAGSLLQRLSAVPLSLSLSEYYSFGLVRAPHPL